MKKYMDPRILLYNSLLRKKCKPTLAHLISLEAGSSQSFVDEEYLVELGIKEKKQRKKYLKSIVKFYFSEMEE